MLQISFFFLSFFSRRLGFDLQIQKIKMTNKDFGWFLFTNPAMLKQSTFF